MHAACAFVSDTEDDASPGGRHHGPWLDDVRTMVGSCAAVALGTAEAAWTSFADTATPDRALVFVTTVNCGANGTGFFDWIKADPDRTAGMASFMEGIYGPQGPKIASGYPFGRFETLIDIGSGNGHILAEILTKHPQLRGALFDLPPTVEVARAFLSQRELTDRCEVFGGDFFDAVPSGYDAYRIKSCLHDWNDSKAVEILQRCRDAMPAHGCVLIVEIVLGPGRPIGHPHRLIDLHR